MPFRAMESLGEKQDGNRDVKVRGIIRTSRLRLLHIAKHDLVRSHVEASRILTRRIYNLSE